MHSSNELMQHRIIFLSEPISSATANGIIVKLLLLDASNKDSQIDFYINSPGGSVTDGLAIIDTMKCIQAPISTICIGQAASMGAWILAAGTKGMRYATPNAEIMIHQVATGFSGQADDIQLFARRIVDMQSRLVNMLSSWTGKEPDAIRRDMHQDFFMDASQAKSYGIIDNVMPFSTPYKHVE